MQTRAATDFKLTDEDAEYLGVTYDAMSVESMLSLRENEVKGEPLDPSYGTYKSLTRCATLLLMMHTATVIKDLMTTRYTIKRRNDGISCII
jgi:hypothetical protein